MFKCESKDLTSGKFVKNALAPKKVFGHVRFKLES